MKNQIDTNIHPLLAVRGLKTEFRLKDGNVLHAVDGIDLAIMPGEIHGLVGEPGCGKTVASFSILKLIAWPGYISGGEALWNGHDLLRLGNQDMRKIRGKEIAMVFQNPQGALNPLYTIGDQMMDVVKLHQSMSKKDAEKKAMRLLLWSIAIIQDTVSESQILEREQPVKQGASFKWVRSTEKRATDFLCDCIHVWSPTCFQYSL